MQHKNLTPTPPRELTSSEKITRGLRERDALSRMAGDPSFMQFETSERFILEAIGMVSGCLPYVKRQTEVICLKSVKNEGLSLKDVRHQTEEICLAALKSHPKAFQYIDTYYQSVADIVQNEEYNKLKPKGDKNV